MLSRVQKIVNDRMELLRKRSQSGKEPEGRRATGAEGSHPCRSELVMEGIRNQLEDQEAATKTENARMRDELYELQPFTFSEGRTP